MDVFCFIDSVLRIENGLSLTAAYTLTGREEFLQDHFEGFPVMPGVLMIETLRQAASLLLASSGGFQEPYHRLARVEDVKFGQFVRPGSLLKIQVRSAGADGPRRVFEGRLELEPSAGRVLSARLVLEPVAASAEARRRMTEGAKAVFERVGGHAA